MDDEPRAEAAAAPLLVFDGLCRFCDGGVQWLLAHDRRGVFRFASSQSPGGRARLAAAGVVLQGETPGTVVLIAGPRAWTHSDAVIEVLARMGAPWSAARIARVVPRAWRDAVYKAFAKRRTQWFGRRSECRVPPPDQRARFVE